MTFKKVLCVRMYVRVSCSPSNRFIQRYLYILAPTCQNYSKSIIYATWVALGRELYRNNNDVQESTVCSYVRSGVMLTIQDVLFKDTYIFLLLHVRATRKVSYMRYKQHLGESCNVTPTWKEVLLCVRIYVRISYSPYKTFYSKIPIYSCSYMSGLREKYHICDISSTWERVVM